MNDSTLLLPNGKRRHRRSSSDECHQHVMRRTTPTNNGRSSVGKQKLTITSPLVTHYLLTLTTAVLSTAGFVGALLAALSCDFIHVSLNESSVLPVAASSILYLNNTTDGWYYNELLEREADHTLSIGIFCPSSLTNHGSNGRVTLSKAFLITSLVLGGFLVNVTCLLSTIIPNTERIWNIISFSSGLAFLCELPIFFILDSTPCNQVDFTCSLSKGSFGLFCSMVCYLILALVTQWREAPDWKEEYELWKLRRRNHVERADGSAAVRDVEMGMANVKEIDAMNRREMGQMDHGNVTPGAPVDQTSTPPPPRPPKTTDLSPSAVRQLEKRLAKQTRMSESSNFLGKYINVEADPTTPERGTEARNISPITHFSDLDHSSAVETEEYVHKSTEISREAQESYVDLINRELQKSLELQKAIKELRSLQKQRELVNEEKDWEQHFRQRELGMQPTEDAEDEMEGELQQLDQQQEQKPPKQLNEISHLSFPSLLDHNDIDANVKTFQQAPFGKDSFDPVFYADMPDLSSVIASIDEDDFGPVQSVQQEPVMALPERSVRAPAEPEHLRDQSKSNIQGHVKALPKPVMKKSVSAPVKQVVNDIARAVDDSSVSKSVRSVSTRSTRGHSAKQSMKSIFRKLELPGKESNSKNRGINDSKEKIEEQWMLEETSLGRSNSDDLLFLVERNKEDGASLDSRRSKVTVLSWASRCKSPEKRAKAQNHQDGKAVTTTQTPRQARNDEKSRVVSPCNGDQFYDNRLSMPSEVIAVEKLDNNGRVNGSAIISPEKDDPGVEMYPSDASLSTLSLPTASDHYTSESGNDRRSKASRKGYTRGISGVSHGTDSETSESEMSLIIAGVQRINRKTCGKPTPLNKRRRRRKRSSRSGCSTLSDYSSQSGSLLDEVIDEEDELNDSGEQVPAVIEASLMKSPKKKSKSPPKKSKNSKSIQYVSLSDAEHSGYESGYANQSDFSDNDAKRAGCRHVSENDESYSSRAARARRSRLLSKRQIHTEPDSDYLEPSDPGNISDASGYKSPSNSRYSGRSSRDGSGSQPRRRQLAYNDTVPLICKDNCREDEFVSLSQRGNTSWQARNSRMSRLRMQRQTSDPIARDPSGVATCNSDEGSI